MVAEDIRGVGFPYRRLYSGQGRDVFCRRHKRKVGQQELGGCDGGGWRVAGQVVRELETILVLGASRREEKITQCEGKVFFIGYIFPGSKVCLFFNICFITCPPTFYF